MAENPVRLKYIESDNFSPGGGVTGVNNTKITAKVKNIAFAKNVVIHYAQADGVWVERPLAWHKIFQTTIYLISPTTALSPLSNERTELGSNYRLPIYRPKGRGLARRD